MKKYKDYVVIGYSFSKKKSYLVMTNVSTGKIILKKIGTVDEGVVKYDSFNKGTLYSKLVRAIFEYDEVGEYINSEHFMNVTLRYYPEKDKWKYFSYSILNLEFKVVKEEYEKLLNRVDVLQMSSLAVRKYVLL